MIKEAAILKDGVVYVGHRHDSICKAYSKGFFNRDTGRIQGFVTNTGEFVDRKEAARIAFECGQIKKPVDGLVSEDLY